MTKALQEQENYLGERRKRNCNTGGALTSAWGQWDDVAKKHTHYHRV